jgi:alkylated DNA repair protein alkB homolog 1
LALCNHDMPFAATATQILDPSSSAYKKARRQHYKTTKNRADVDGDRSPFRAAEKKYKIRFPPPDLSDVLDLALLNDARRGEIAEGGWRGRADTVVSHEIQLKDASLEDRKAYTIPRIPGMSHSHT